MKGSRIGIGIIGLLIIGIEFALAFFIMPQSYQPGAQWSHGVGGTVAWITFGGVVFATALFFGLVAYGAGMHKDRGDLPAWIASPYPALLYAMAAALTYAITPFLGIVSAVAIHLVLLALLVLVGGGLVLGARHLRADEGEDRAAENGYQQMVLAGNAASRSLDSNPESSRLSELNSALSKLLEDIQYSDRGGVPDTVALEQDITNDLRALGADMSGVSPEQDSAMAARIQQVANKVAERRDLLKMKK